MKAADGKDDAWEKQWSPPKGDPGAWIQWKGTSICMDVLCVCGQSSHVDAEFAYYVECPKCGQVYFCNGHIELIAMKERPNACIVMDEDTKNDLEFYNNDR